MGRTILVVHSSDTEPVALERLLSGEYSVLSASDAHEAAALLRQKYKIISAIVLAASTPRPEGHSLLWEIKQNFAYQSIPVIAIVSDEKKERDEAVLNGANGVLTKPVDRALLLHMLHNEIKLRENASMLNILWRDKLTGLLNREAFFQEAERLISRHQPCYYVMSCVDVDHFKLINDQYGTEKGDLVLQHIAACISGFMLENSGICCRFASDRFAILYPAAMRDTKALMSIHADAMSPKCIPQSVRFRIGRYVVSDRTMPVSAMYDRATLAQESIKGRYDVYISHYDDSMREEMLSEQRIVTEMTNALRSGAFVPYFQPQYNHKTGAMIGSEALVRWNREGRAVPPNEFIPVFERNGFIYQVDQYIWRQVCILLRRWLDEGRDPLPVSVNISRFDFFQADFLSVISGLVREYDLPADLLRLEITETAFAESSKTIIHVVKELIAAGFTVEIDDFGSGYSSLNTLKDVPAGILKLDMHFLENPEDAQRGGSILESIVRMAKWLGMAVIAEGVEERSQADYLKSIGCYYVQGYLYAKPMPAEEYELLQGKIGKERELARLKTLDTLNNNEFWNPRSMETLIFNSYIGGACIFEYHDGGMEILRYNDSLARIFTGHFSCDFTYGDDPHKFFDGENQSKLLKSVRATIDTAAETTCEVELSDGNGHYLYLRTTFRQIAVADGRYLFYCVILDVTEQREAEKKQIQSARQLEVIMGNINGGVSAIRISDEGTSELVFTNEKYFELYGYTKEQALSGRLDVLTRVVPEDLPQLLEKVRKLKADRVPTIIDYRVMKRDGRLAYLRANSSLMNIEGFDGVITSVVTDITEQRRLSDSFRAVVDNISGAVTATVLRAGKPTHIIVNDRYFEMLGYTRAEYEAECRDQYAVLHPDDRARVVEQFEASATVGNAYTQEFRIVRRDGSVRRVESSIRVINIFGVDEPVQLAVANDVTKEYEYEEQLRFLNDSAHDILAQPDSGRAVEETLQKLMAYFRADRAYIVEVDREKGVSSNTYEVCADGVRSEKDGLQSIPLDVSAAWFDMLRQNEFIDVKDVRTMDAHDGALQEMLLRQKIFSIILAPLWRDGVMIGFVGVDNPARETRQISRLTALGDYLAVLLTRRDLDQKIVRDNAAIREKESQLELLTSSIPGGLATYAITADGISMRYFNDGYFAFSGCTRQAYADAVEKDPLHFVLEEDRHIVQSMVRGFSAHREDGHVNGCKLRCRTLDGGYRWMSVKTVLTKQADGSFVVNVVQLDLTEQTEAEETQKALLDNLPCGAALYAFDGEKLSVIHINKSYWQLVDRAPVDYRAASVMDAIHPDDRAIVRMELNAAIHSKRNVSVDVRIRCGEDEYKPFHISVNITKGKDGRYLLFASYTLVSEQTMSFQQMFPIALSTMMSASGDLSYVKDRELRYVCSSHSAAQTLGLQSERDIIGKTDYDLFDRSYADAYAADDRRILETGESVLERIERIPFASGDVLFASTSKYPIKDARGNVVGLYGISRDITAERKTDFELDTLLHVIPSGVLKYSADEKQTFAYFNRNLVEGLGYTEDGFMEKFHNSFREMVWREDRARVEEEVLRQEGAGGIGRFNYRIEAADGQLRWFHDEGVKVADQDGKSWYYVTLVDVTEQMKVEENLRMSEEMNRLAIEHSGNIITRFDVKTRTLTLPASFNPIFVLPQVLYNMPEEQISLGRISAETAHIYRELFESIVRGDRTGTYTYQQNSSRGWRWLEAQYTTIFSDSGEPVSAVISFTDVTEKLEKEVIYNKWQQSLTERLDDSYTLFRSNLSRGASYDGREGNLIKFPYDGSDRTFDEHTADYAKACVYEEDRKKYRSFLRCDKMLTAYARGHRSDVMEYRELLPGGGARWLRLSVDLVEYPNSKDVEVYLMYENIDEHKRAELLTLEKAETDPLTGVYNRSAFIYRLEQLLSMSEPGKQHALLMLDVDEFKHVNDTLGHGAGDQVLRDLTSGIRARLRHDDLVGRLGGDEFFVFLRDIPNRDTAAMKAGQICALRIRTGESEEPVTVSIGIAMAPADGNSFDALYQKADAALYREKKRGKNGFLFASEPEPRGK